MSNKSIAAQKHLQIYFRAEKANLLALCTSKSSDSVKLALTLGALSCIYWQALGNGLIAFAKGVRLFISKSYPYHDIRLLHVTG
jgi:hypothetical protein